MIEIGQKNPNASLESLGLQGVSKAFWNLSPDALIEETIKRGQGILADNGALVVSTGEFTGRSPKDRFIVEDSITSLTVDWGHINMKFDPSKFDQLERKLVKYLEGKDVFIRDAMACADAQYRLNIRVATEYPWSNQFVSNMFIRPTKEEIEKFEPEWTVLCAPGFHADASVDTTRQHNFAIINFTKKKIIIGGTAYTGEIKKGIFSVLNFILPHERDVLSMHCSANVGSEGDTAIFFGLSGTGKTTLSADPDRELIGDDEHGWSDDGVFNFEGGCYAKCIDLTEEKEPDIYRAIKPHAILENIIFKEGSNEPDYANSEITQNTRVSYPIDHIQNARNPSTGGVPDNIFFLTCDAFGVLPPISKLTPGQAMYHFISGYTAKVAGTEEGIIEPVTTFSACFGSPFLPLHPTKYAEMLGDKMRKHKTNVWLINTGWTGGSYGAGSRIKLKYTRAMIGAALEGNLNDVGYDVHPVFGLHMPVACPNVPDDLLDPKNTWDDKEDYDRKAMELARSFVENFKQFEHQCNHEILAAAPKIATQV